MTPYKNFLIRGELPPNEDEAQCFKRKTRYYIILDGELLKKRLIAPVLKCLKQLKGRLRHERTS